MEKNTMFFVDMLRAGAIGRDIPYIPDDIDWKIIHRLATEHNVLAIIFSVIQRLPTDARPPDDIFNAFKFNSIARALQQINSYETLKKVLKALDTAGIPVVLFKGIVLGSLYDDYRLRPSCDSDLLIHAEDSVAATKIFADMGFVQTNPTTRSNTLTFTSSTLTIDLHTRIWGDTNSRHITAIERKGIDDFSKCVIFSYQGIEALSFGIDDHFLYILIHMAKHFIIKGSGLRHLLDISIYFNRYKDEIDIPEIWKTIDEMGFHILYNYVFRVCVKYLGMDSSILIDSDFEEDSETTAKLTKDIVSSGLFGNSPERAVSHNVVKESYYVGIVNKNPLSLTLHLLFPNAAALPMKYSYAKRHKILLPAAWIHRMFRFLFHRVFQNNHVSLPMALHLADERIKLLENLDMVD